MPSYRRVLREATRLRREGDFSAAVAEYERAIQIDPEPSDAYYGLALAHHGRGALREAVAAFEQVALRNPRDATVWNNLGVLHHTLNDPVAAEEAFRRALELDEGYAEARRNLEIITRARGPRAGKLALFCGPDDKFIRDILRHLATRWEVRTFRGGTLQQMQELMAWSDVSWFEWCDQFIVQGSQLPKVARIVCRLHRYEAFTEAPMRVNWHNVDCLVFTAEQIRDLVAERIPDLEKRVRTEVVRYGVDLDRFAFGRRRPGHDVAYVGYIHNRKNPSLLLQCVRALVDVDPRYTLHVAGYHQERLYELYWDHMVHELGLQDNVRMYGWVDNVDRWLEDKQYLLSTSVHESFGYGIAEAMARGLKPVIHNFPGASAIWPKEYLFNTIDECRRMIVSGEYDSAAYRKYIEEHYSLAAQLACVDALLDELYGGPESGSRVPAGVGTTSYPVKVNLACGSHYHHDYLNVDISDAYPHDLTADVTDLAMIPDETFEEALASHILEHIDRDGAVPALREWRRILKAGGWLEVRVPDIHWLLTRFHEGHLSRAELVRRVYGDTGAADVHVAVPDDLEELVAQWAAGQLSLEEWCLRVYDTRYGQGESPEAHRWGWDLDSLTAALREAGFDRVFAVSKDAPLDPDARRPGRVDPATLVMRAARPEKPPVPAVVRHVGSLRLGLLLPELKELPNPRYGSIAKIVSSIVPYYVREGVEVHVLCRRVSRRPEETLGGVHYHRYRYDSVGDYVRWAEERTNDLKLDIVEVLNRPWVLATRAVQVIRMANDHFRAEQAASLKSVRRLVVLSEYLRRQTRARLPDLADRVVVNHEGVDLDTYRPCAKHHAPTLLFVGVHQREKGLHYFVDLASRLAEEIEGLRVVIAGPATVSGSGDADFVEEVRGRAPRITEWLGEVDDDALPALYGGATVFVAPMPFPFTWSLALVEAQACGTPVITTPVGGLPETLLHGETGFLVRTGRELLEKARYLLRHRKEAEDMGMRGREFVRRFSWEHTARRALAIYEQVLSDSDEAVPEALAPQTWARRSP